MLRHPVIPVAIARRPPRRLAAGLAALVCGLTAGSSLLAATPASAEPVAISAPALQAQAADLAARIEVMDEQLSVLAERYNQARLVVDRAEGALATAQAEAAEAERAVTEAKATLKGQAVSAYLNGGPRQSSSAIPRPYRLNAEDGIRRNYTRAAVDATQRAIDAIHQSQRALADRQRGVRTAAADARSALDKADDDRGAAASTESLERGLLAQVNGRLGALVRAEQARRAAAAAAAAKQAALARQQAAKPKPSPTKPTTPTTSRSSSGGTAPPPTTTTTTTPSASPPPPSTKPLPAPNATKANKAIAAAQAQLGKPYEWGGAGPDTFDCSGLTAWAWKAAGVYLPHSSMAQYQMLPFVPVDKLAPGDLVFYGSDIHHVGLYIGNGQMIEAPHTGANVRYASIWRSDIVSGGRPT
jgi:cell wall-associated NlpC family hydrolase